MIKMVAAYAIVEIALEQKAHKQHITFGSRKLESRVLFRCVVQRVSAYECAEHGSKPAFSTAVLKSAQIPVSAMVLGEVMGLGQAQILRP